MMDTNDVLSSIDTKVQEAIAERKGFVVVMSGSDSDREHVDKIRAALHEYGIRSEWRIGSAHKQPGLVQALINAYDAIGAPLAYVGVVTKTDALSGLGSYHALNPLISCPADNINDTCLTNPPGSSNAYVGDPKNAARFIAQIFSHLDPAIKRKLADDRDGKIAKLEKADAAVRGLYEPPPKEAK
jgi:phosphoribosylcarboxyaminoimidazole (NCAIR) mutase